MNYCPDLVEEIITHIIIGFRAHLNIILPPVPGFSESNLPSTAHLAQELCAIYLIALDNYGFSRITFSRLLHIRK